ncbi:Leucine-rich repeat-containing protein isoform 3 [Schistosoma japonicum]|uniref:Leucine-rich repeat-containing protein isoform 3 n=1 Tax=Schistosoma japonicum TaxID=6182 RepID=A0A4Z2DAR0_SCHJA|nr:Leucine-rich repeat-containing protein isoform 3 [Schistosoma japonicum]
MVLESESFQRKYISRKTKNVIKVESPKAGIIEGNNFSSLGNANYAGYQSMRSTDIHLRMSLPKAACYKKITCETLMVDGFQANKLKRPTNRHLSTNFNKYKQTPLPWNCFTKSSLSSQEDKCGKLEEKNVNNQHQHQPLQRQQINSHPLQPSPLLSPSSSSSLSSSTLKSSIDLNKVESKATKKSSLVRNVKISNQKSCQNDKYLVDAEAFTALMKYGCYQKQEVIRYEQMNLTKCPIINSNEINRYLSFQSNQIYQITNLQNMTKLVYLNLSENQLISLNGLETLYSLRILLLGNNHIKHIDGLDNLYNLNVLDLNHNEIKTIENISHLTKLYYLNLSYNCITYVNGLSGLTSLIELNLKHNHIQCIESIENVPKLIWVFLSFNHIEKWSQISGLAHLNLFTQVTLDGNPIVSDRIYQKMVSNDKRFFKENTIVFPLRPYENESVNNLIIDDQCLFKTNVPISFLLDNKECFPVKQKLTTPTTIMDETLLNHLEKNEHQQQNESELGVNCRNNSTDSFTENLTELTNHSDLTSYHIKPNTYTYSQNESSNLLQSNLSILSTSSDLKSFSAKSTIDKMNEDDDDDWTNEVIDLNVETNSNDDDDDVNNYEEKNKTNYNSVGTLTNESILFPLKSSTRDNLLQFTYYLRRPTHLIIEGTLYTTVFNVTDDDKFHKMKAVDVIENVNNSTKKINELVKHEIIFDHFSLLIDDLQSYQSNNDDNNNTNMPENYMDDDDDEEEEEERNYSPETLNLNCVVKLTVRNVNWNVFANYIPKLHELLPHLKELNLENNELKYLHQITDLIPFEHLTELNITGSDSNSIVEQAGHLWRSFIIWSLADALNLSFFNGELVSILYMLKCSVILTKTLHITEQYSLIK